MKRNCLNCEQKDMVHTVRDVPYTYKGHHTVIPEVKGWHCCHCGEVEFDAGEGVRFAKPMQSVTNLFKLLDNHPALLDEITSRS